MQSNCPIGGNSNALRIFLNLVNHVVNVMSCCFSKSIQIISFVDVLKYQSLRGSARVCWKYPWSSPTQIELAKWSGVPDTTISFAEHGPKTMVFKNTPMGMGYNNNGVITRVDPDSQAENLGVEIGWTIVSVNQKPCTGSPKQAVLWNTFNQSPFCEFLKP